ncbi:hypothetical protein BQ8482_960008 [Mesorhizobium delmotii]|uniref:Uncharacterized protein n=1 Tax=Mesorhizobium delmotii TaxID=1631247 RepID=A0A2P9AXV9_9HYPH|nr:hypothetical protein BQ8482_960008 [Mesorhizobium delmotii]
MQAATSSACCQSTLSKPLQSMPSGRLRGRSHRKSGSRSMNSSNASRRRRGRSATSSVNRGSFELPRRRFGRLSICSLAKTRRSCSFELCAAASELRRETPAAALSCHGESPFPGDDAQTSVAGEQVGCGLAALPQHGFDQQGTELGLMMLQWTDLFPGVPKDRRSKCGRSVHHAIKHAAPFLEPGILVPIRFVD